MRSQDEGARLHGIVLGLCAALGCAALSTLLGIQTKAAEHANQGSVEQFREQAEALLSESHAQKALWGIVVADAATGEPIYELNADHFFTPASNAKIFTTALALATLGNNYRFRTTLETKGTLSKDGQLNSDLILVGRGDPDISNRKFPFTGRWDREGPPESVLAEMAAAAVAKGLKEVDGDIVADDSYYPYDPYPAGWTVGDMLWSFGAPVGALTFDDNTVIIDIRPGAHVGDPANLKVQPEAARQSFEAQLKTVAAGGQTDLAVVRQPEPNFILLRGTIPIGGQSSHLELAMTQPSEVAGIALKRLLEAKGVIVRGAVRVMHSPPPVVSASGEPGKPEADNDPDDRTVLAEHLSPPLIESVRMVNKISHNLHAELLLRAVGREKFGTGSTAAGLEIERGFLKAAGVAEGDVVLTDGSGLAPQDLVTPRSIVAVLKYAQQQPWGAEYEATFPVAGVDGTLENRFNKGAGKGVIHAKTGDIDDVRALSGYATTKRGERIIFSIMTNENPQHGLDATATLDGIAAAMVETLGEEGEKK